MQNRQKIVALAGPSCGGKTTLKNALVEGWPGSFAAILTTTTRPKRPGEKEGRDYHFVSPRQFNSAKAGGQFVETLVIGEYVYGLSLAALTGALTGARNGVVVITPDGLP
ncbi:MAG: guanylate kinase, partial [Gammaproteobacteria bacterium]|nr:guanylate kinase [Gammaproteobacteria bacterium]